MRSDWAIRRQTAGDLAGSLKKRALRRLILVDVL